MLVSVFRQAIAEQSTLVPKIRPAIMLPGCGHWTQQERAQEVNAAVVDFLRQF
jgi:pimeloyl-ACP methyl ester carboxylesterase